MKVKTMCYHLYYRQSNTFRFGSHPTEPVVTQDSKDADFQHQVSRNANSKQHNQLHQICTFLKLWTRRNIELLVPADGDICAYRRRLVVLHPGCEVEQAGHQQVDEGDHHRESQQAGLIQQGVLCGTWGGARTCGLEVLLGRDGVLFNVTAGCSVVLQLSEITSKMYLFSQIFVILLILTTSCTAVSQHVTFFFWHSH